MNSDSDSNIDSENLNDPNNDPDDLDLFSVSDFKRLLSSSGVADLKKLTAAQGLANESDEKTKSLQQAIIKAS